MNTYHNPRVLISVSDKTGIVEFAYQLQQLGWEIISTGGTAEALRRNGLTVIDISTITGMPEMLDGRVKTLHPKVHAALLAKRNLHEHRQTLIDFDIRLIDALVVNLYPFERTIARSDCSFDEAIENIDIGGPAMLRAAAKNFSHVSVLTDPSDYTKFVDLLSHPHQLEYFRFELACKVFAYCARYDSVITQYLSTVSASQVLQQSNQIPQRTAFPEQLFLHAQLVQTLRYGENPQQNAAWYRELNSSANSLSSAKQLQGKELSYNNLLDSDSAWGCVNSFTQPACVIVKHANPCGAAKALNALDAYRKALACDPVSAFGGIIALNTEVDEHCAMAIIEIFTEIVIARKFSDAALAIFASKPPLRLLEIADDGALTTHTHEIRKISGGWLVQTPDTILLDEQTLRCVTKKTPTASQYQDLLFAWNMAKYVKSNAIVFARDQATLGVGAGQMSRVDSSRIAISKAQQAGLSLEGSVVASDAFFPFRDGVEALINAGISAIIQPGGAQRDEEVIACADEYGLAMLFTAIRHFRH